MTIAAADQPALLIGGTYINIHTPANPTGELRAQVITAVNGDGAANQYYMTS